MKVTITNLRRNLFQLVEKTLTGEQLEFTHKGILFRVVPEIPARKLDRLTAETVVSSDSDLAVASRELLDEMEAEWEKDWSEL